MESNPIPAPIGPTSGPFPMKRSNALPAIIVAALLITAFGLISLLHVISNKPILFVDYWLNAFGIDFEIFYKAAQNIVAGRSPYAIAMDYNRYVYTPIPALAYVAFVPLGFEAGRVLLYVLIPLSLAAGYLTISSAFSLPSTLRNPVLVAGLACLLFGYPSYFLIQRENIDGWVFLFLCLGLYFSQKARREPWSGLFFSLAIAFKIYPVLILLPILAYRRWRLLIWTTIWLALLAGISFPWHSGFRTGLAGRLTDFELRGNGSLVATLVGFDSLLGMLGIPIPSLNLESFTVIAAIIYAALLGPAILADFAIGRTIKYHVATAALYVPFMIAWPRLSYPYAFVVCAILIPATCHLWQENANRIQNVILVVLTVGIFLSQAQAFALYNLTQSELAYAVPGLGLLILMAGITLYKLLAWRLSIHPHVATDQPTGNRQSTDRNLLPDQPTR